MCTSIRSSIIPYDFNEIIEIGTISIKIDYHFIEIRNPFTMINGRPLRLFINITSYCFGVHVSNSGEVMDVFLFSGQARPDCIYICYEFGVMRFPLLGCNMILVSDNICCLSYISGQYFIKLDTLMNLIFSKLDESYSHDYVCSSVTTILEYKPIQFKELINMHKIIETNNIISLGYNGDYVIRNEIYSSEGDKLIEDNQTHKVMLNSYGRSYISLDSHRCYETRGCMGSSEYVCYKHQIKVVNYNKRKTISLTHRLINWVFRNHPEYKILSKRCVIDSPLFMAWISHNTFLYISKMDQCLINVDIPQKVGIKKMSYTTIDIKKLESDDSGGSKHFYELRDPSGSKFYSKSSIMNICNWINRRNIILPYTLVEKSEPTKKVNYWRYLPINVMSVIARFAS
jgi:hypothetical protein